MKRDRFAQVRYVIAAISVCLGAWAVFEGLIQSTPVPARHEDNNPQHFYLQSKGSVYTYAFTCDPRAADVWLFTTGGGTMFVLNPPPDAFSSGTNNLIIR